MIPHLMASDNVVAEWESPSVSVKAKIIAPSMMVTVLPIQGRRNGAPFDLKFVRIEWKPAAWAVVRSLEA
ncbi:hypothetical protein [Nocardia transvalensis]|uniref:hypothetical protein n=1 Tax=Nocardia transvalensis TaxID=37333 RepID=UPI001894102A|nr:hypothetical protein [Nocardia transvalensis]MBF6330832.1 hypothetical protein [Nocardia transvalensis]